MTHDRHMSHFWDQDHWIPGEILTILHVKHFSVAQSAQKLAKMWHMMSDGHMSRVWDYDHWIPGEILTILHVKYFTVAQSGQKLAKTWHETRDAWRRRVTCLGPSPLDSWWNSDHFTCKILYCSSIWSKVSKNVTRDTWRVTDTCHVSGTMTIGFLVKLWPFYM